MYKKFIKRILDFFFALILIIILGIPMIIIAIVIKMEDNGEIIFKQKRIGKNLKPFYIYKFRSMRSDRKQLKSTMRHDEMVTSTGKFIRKTSLDELPQLFNIIKGEMSFIGPRPWIEEYYDFFSDKQKNRNNVLPGITGLAQAKGRNGISITKKIDYDLEYVEKVSFKLDCKIIVLTIKELINKEESEISEKGIKEEINELKQLTIQTAEQK